MTDRHEVPTVEPAESRMGGTEHGTSRPPLARITCAGKFLRAGVDKFWARGVTYGTFRPRDDGGQFPSPEVVETDFASMADNGINTVRVYTVPPRWLLDAAAEHGLRVMVGLPWEQHIAFLDERGRGAAIERRVREGVRACAGHPAVLCYAVGNEIPASIVRWHGARRVERFIERLYRAVKDEDPEALVTYVNFPTTEYLRLPFLDLFCFNVYLEQRERLDAYLARLQNLADERPLLLAEIGLDSHRNGEQAQAESLEWQIRSAFAAGCAGTFVFAWTDEWYRGGHDIDDWDFGLTTRARGAKKALEAVRRVYADVPFPEQDTWPRISVVVCSYNGERTIRDTLEGLAQLEYPDYETVVVNDGSTDATPRIAEEYDVHLISTENRGLSNARNTGWQAATGEIVAYIDDDAYPDPHWLHYLAHAFQNSDFAGVGGPNLAPPGDGPIAECVYNSPGGPVHVLTSDTVAEHIPGCNMSFRRAGLAAVGGFDARYRAAGDDVDLCWRIQDQVGPIGFHPAAMVWHHRRNSLRMYWRQQKGYGKAEALLEEKWPERYNPVGHLTWAGRLYGKGFTQALRVGRWRVYHGSWGSAPFQPLYEPEAGTLLSLPLMPEWYLVVGFLGALTGLGLLWPPLLLVGPLLVLALIAPFAQALKSAARAEFSDARPPVERWGLRALTAFMHLQQPLARLIGRLQHGLTPWRRRVDGGFGAPVPRTDTLWSEHWRSPEEWLETLQSELRDTGAVVMAGGPFERWDLSVRGGLLGALRIRLAVEEHGAGRQLLRLRTWPRFSGWGIALFALLAVLSGMAAADGAVVASVVLGGSAAALAGLAVAGAGGAAAAWRNVLGRRLTVQQ